MIFSLIQSHPMIAFAWVIAILVSLTVHEFSHALASKLKGDLTAERLGRLTLNPMAHIDWTGFVAVLLLGFGWAKPVPFNPYNLKNPKWDSVLIALAGPFSNLILAIISALIFRNLIVTAGTTPASLLVVFLLFMVILNLFLLFFNVIPIHPLDGSKLVFAIFDKPKHEQIRRFISVRGPQILMVLVVASLLTSYNVFFFVSAPSFAVCDGLLSTSCMGSLSSLFSL
ncbi:MAG: site-2 protease family protein [bacterium]|nr:site-2 protease family protein [bacterium]